MRLSVFVGGGGLHEVEAVCAATPATDMNVLDGISGLVDQSLVVARPASDGLRIRLLETVRRYAADRLAEDPAEQAATRRRHATAYAALVEAAAEDLPGRDQVRWLERLTYEHDNLRAATTWAIEADDGPLALRLGAASWRFWQIRGHLDEGRAVIRRILEMPSALMPTLARAQALGAAGGLAWWAADIAAADALYAEQLDVARGVGDRRAIADATFDLAHTRYVLEQHEDAFSLQAEARRLYEQLGDDRALARVEWTSVFALMASGTPEAARELMLSLLPRFKTMDDEFYVGMVTMALGGISLAIGDLEGGWRWGARAMLSYHAMGDTAHFTLGFRGIALLCLLMGRPRDAAMFNGAFEYLGRQHGIRPPNDPVFWIPVSPRTQRPWPA